MIFKTPQIRFDNKRLDYDFSVDIINVTCDGTEDIFDFSGLPDGEIDSSLVDTILEFNPIISAKKENGVLSVVLLNFISEDATEEEKFPEWTEV